MRWLWKCLPVVSKAVHFLEVLRRDDQIAELKAQRDYWQLRAERLTDAALVRAGAIHEPTMVERKVQDPRADPASMITAALSVHEIDSTKRKGVS